MRSIVYYLSHYNKTRAYKPGNRSQLWVSLVIHSDDLTVVQLQKKLPWHNLMSLGFMAVVAFMEGCSGR